MKLNYLHNLVTLMENAKIDENRDIEINVIEGQPATVIIDKNNVDMREMWVENMSQNRLISVKIPISTSQDLLT